jgi:hypothetical protein
MLINDLKKRNIITFIFHLISRVNNRNGSSASLRTTLLGVACPDFFGIKTPKFLLNISIFFHEAFSCYPLILHRRYALGRNARSVQAGATIRAKNLF